MTHNKQKKLIFVLLVFGMLLNFTFALYLTDAQPTPYPILSLTSKDFNYKNLNADYNVFFKSNSNLTKAINFQTQGYDFNFDIRTSQLHWWSSSLGAIVGMTAEMNPQNTNAIIANNIITYPNAWLNTDLQYSASSGNLKETLIIRGVGNPTNGTADFLQYGSNNYFTNSLLICADGNCYAHPSSKNFITQNQIEFRDTNNKLIFYLPVPIITDSNGNKVAGTYAVNANNGIAIINIRIPRSFITNAVFPIYFDPSLYVYDTTTYSNNNFDSFGLVHTYNFTKYANANTFITGITDYQWGRYSSGSCSQSIVYYHLVFNDGTSGDSAIKNAGVTCSPGIQLTWTLADLPANTGTKDLNYMELWLRSHRYLNNDTYVNDINISYDLNYTSVTVTFNVFKTGTTTDLTGINVDCNIDSLDLTNQTSPFSKSSEGNTYASCIFSKTGFDSNTQITNYDANKTMTIYLKETTAPVTTFSGCASTNWNNSNQTITLSCSDNLSGCASTDYRVDSSGAFTNYTIPFTLSTDGNHKIDYNSTDNLGNIESTKTSYCAVDKTAPTVGTTGLSGFSISTSYIKGTGNIATTASDSNSGVASCEYTINNGGAWASADKNSTHCYKNSLSISNGVTYQFNLRATDNVANVETGTASSSYVGNLIPPVTTMSYTILDNNNTATITLTCTDTNGGGCASTKYMFDSNGTWYTYSAPFTFTGIGHHTLDYNSTDNVGNVETMHVTDLNMPVLLTIKYPKNVQSLTQITEKWSLRTIGGLLVNLTDLNTDRNVYVAPNTLTTFYIIDVNGNYVQNTYTRTYYADSNNGTTDTLQPYLYSIATSLATTINVLNKNSLAPIPNITIKFYGNLPGIGNTLIGQGTTDSKGQLLQLFIAGQSYVFQVYNGSTLLQTYNYTAVTTQAYIYFNFLVLDSNNIPPVTVVSNSDLNLSQFFVFRNILFNSCTGQNACFPSALIAIVLTIIALIAATSVTGVNGAFIGIKGLSIIAFCCFTIFLGIGFLPLFIYAFLGTITLIMAVVVQ